MADFTIHTSTLFDPKKKAFVPDVSITVNPASGLIVDVFTRTEKLGDSVPNGDIDLRGKFVLPGFVDAHTHIFLHSYDERPSLNQKRDESVVERTVRAVNHCRTALLSGYTTYRDLGSESMQDSDAHVRDAINRGLTVGPRLFVATKALASTGTYESRTENHQNGHCLPHGAQTVDGPEDARRAVRQRIAAGADVIKFYADYRRRIQRYPPAQQHPYIPSVLYPPEQPNPDVLVFDQAEMDMIVHEAKLAKAPVACHAGTLEGALMAINAGTHTLEHGYFADEGLFKLMKSKGTIFVPTLAVCERLHKARFKEILAQTTMAYKIGVKFACGGDTGTYPHGQGVREMELMMDAGMSLEDVLAANSIGGWESCGGDLCGVKFGWFEKGLRADIIALNNDPRENREHLRRVDFVMKDAQIWKRDGKAFGIIQNDHEWDTWNQ